MPEEFIASPISAEQQEKRVCQRIEINRSVQLQLENGLTIKGLTDDVSLGGVKIITRDEIDSSLLETQINKVAIVQVIFVDGQLSAEYPCSIVRCESGAICLELDKKKAASFGMMLTRGSFKQAMK